MDIDYATLLPLLRDFVLTFATPALIGILLRLQSIYESARKMQVESLRSQIELLQMNSIPKQRDTLEALKGLWNNERDVRQQELDNARANQLESDSKVQQLEGRLKDAINQLDALKKSGSLLLVARIHEVLGEMDSLFEKWLRDARTQAQRSFSADQDDAYNKNVAEATREKAKSAAEHHGLSDQWDLWLKNRERRFDE